LAAVESLEVLASGPLTTVQDLGRFGYGRYGVPPSGATDSLSLRIGNLLVGNPENAAGLEITLMGLKVRAFRDLAIAITGADLNPCLNEQPVEMWRSLFIKKDDTLSFGGLRSGCRAYLTLGGEISLHPVMGSRSTNLSSKFGGLSGRPLHKGDILRSESPRLHLRTTGRGFYPEWIPLYTKCWTMRVAFGPQDDQFTHEIKNLFLDSSYIVTPQSDRAGIRLSGPAILQKEGLEASILSEGVVAGTIQIPGDGQPIIILGETVTGGYRKIATIISADLPFLGQIKPGDSIRFREVTLDEAIEALSEMERRIGEFKNGLSD
jgi:antagonist of KipI